MDRNPYQMMLDAFGGSSGSADSGGLVLGKVTSSAPLKVLVGGTTMEHDELLRSAELAPDTFRVGDQLLMFPIEEAQRYIILCKVVAL